MSQTFSIKSIFLNPLISINIETKYAIPQIDNIIERVGDQIHNITIGRTDLSASYFDERIKQGHEEVTKNIVKVLESIQNCKIFFSLFF